MSPRAGVRVRRGFTLLEVAAGVAMTATALLLFSLAEAVARKSSARHAELFAIAEGELAVTNALRADLAEALTITPGPKKEPRTLIFTIVVPSLDGHGNPAGTGVDEIFYEHAFTGDGTHQLTRRVAPASGSSRNTAERVISRRFHELTLDPAPGGHRVTLEQGGRTNLAKETVRRIELLIPSGLPARGGRP